jgi:aminoglycoside phosphotransferase (APT) family kinase protein
MYSSEIIENEYDLEKIKEFITKHYEIEEIKEYKKIETGWENSTIKLTTKSNQSYILRVSNFVERREEYYTHEYKILTFLTKYTNKVPKIIMNKDNTFYSLYNDSFSILFDFIDGKHYGKKDLNNEERIEQVTILTELFSKIHKYSYEEGFQFEGYRKSPTYIELENKLDSIKEGEVYSQIIDFLKMIPDEFKKNQIEIEKKLPKGINYLFFYNYK